MGELSKKLTEDKVDRKQQTEQKVKPKIIDFKSYIDTTIKSILSIALLFIINEIKNFIISILFKKTKIDTNSTIVSLLTSFNCKKYGLFSIKKDMLQASHNEDKLYRNNDLY
jgi:hypothetical protein